MRLSYVIFSLFLTLVSSCGRPGVRSFWDNRSIDYSDIRAAENQFADFAELAVSAPEKDALYAMDVLFDKLQGDTVAHYLYADWVDGAFYSMLSPCRNATLYSKAVDRMVEESILSPDEIEPYLRRREWIQYNQVGAQAVVPGLAGLDGRTLVLVLDLGCPSCRRALESLSANSRWGNARKVAVGLGIGPKIDVPGWEYVIPENGTSVFDIDMTPFFFVIAPDGTVESGYELAL